MLAYDGCSFQWVIFRSKPWWRSSYLSVPFDWSGLCAWRTDCFAAKALVRVTETCCSWNFTQSSDGKVPSRCSSREEEALWNSATTANSQSALCCIWIPKCLGSVLSLRFSLMFCPGIGLCSSFSSSHYSWRILGRDLYSRGLAGTLVCYMDDFVGLQVVGSAWLLLRGSYRVRAAPAFVFAWLARSLYNLSFAWRGLSSSNFACLAV